MAFIGAVKYRVIHKTVTDQTETEYKIEIKESGYSGAVTELVGWGDTFALIYDRINPDQPLANPIQKARFELDFVIRQTGPEMQFIQDVSDADEEEFVLDFYIDNVLEWSGFVMPDLLEYSQGDYPAKARIVAKDFTRLAGYNVPLSDTRASAISFIRTFIQSGSYLGYPSAFDIYAYTSWTSDDISPTASFLDAIYIDQKAFRYYSPNPDEADRPFTGEEALTAILRNFGLILRQAKGAYRLYQLSALDTVGYVDAYKYDSTFPNPVISTINELITVQPGSDLYVLPSTNNIVLPGIKKTSVTWNHRLQSQSIKIPDRVEIVSGVAKEYTGQGIIGDGKKVVRLNASYTVTERELTSKTFVQPFGRIEIKITGTTDYYLISTGQWIDENDTTTTARDVRVLLTPVETTTYLDLFGNTREKQRFVGTFDIESIPIPAGITGELSVKFLTSTNGYTNGDKIDQYFSSVRFQIIGDEAIENTVSVQYTAENDSKLSYQYDHGAVLFGPGPVETSESAIRSDINDDTSIITDWKRINDVSNDTFFGLLTREIMQTQSTARVLQADLMGKYSAHNLLRFEANTFFFLGGSISGSGQARGEFLSIQVSNVGVISIGRLDLSANTGAFPGFAYFHNVGINTSFDQSQYVAKTDEIMTGTVTQIPVTPVGYVIGKAGDEIAVFNIVSGAVEVFTMAESYVPGADAIQVESKALSGPVANGSYVIYTGKRVSSYITQTDNAIVLGVRTADLALLSDDSILTNEDGDEYFFTEGDVTSNLIYTEAQINIRADQILAAVSAIVGEDLTVLNDIVADIAELQSKVDTAEADIDDIENTLLTLPTAVEFTALESQVEINTDSIRLGVRAFSLALFDNNDEFLLSDDSELVFVDTENGDILALIRYNESLINVERDRIDLKVLEIGAGFSLGKLYFTLNSGVSYSTVTFIANNDSQELAFRNGDVLRITNNAGEQEEVRVSGDQTIPASSGLSVASVNIVAKTFQYTHLRLASYVSFPGYATGSEINLLKDEIVLKVNNAGQIASINLDGSAEFGSAITISADQINIEGVVTAINSATAKIDDTQVTGTKAIIYSASEPSVRPSGSALEAGDTWFDTDAGNKPYVYSGSAWVAAYTEIDGGAITTGTVNAARIDVSGVISAGSIIVQSALDSAINTAVAGVNVTIRSTSEPTQRPDTTALQEGDLWIDTDNGDRPYVYSGSAWVASYTIIDGGNITTGTIDASVVTVDNLDASNITTGTLSADRVDVSGVISAGSIIVQSALDTAIDGAKEDVSVTIRATSEPSLRPDGESLQAGDIWIDTDAGNKPYIWSGSAWVAGYTQIDGGSITTGTVSADRIDVSGVITAGSIIVQSALDTAIDTAVEGVTVTIRSDSEPTQRPDTSALQEGDIWIDTNDGNKPYTYSGSAWVAAYTSIDGGNITTGTIDASVVTVSNIDANEITTGTLSADRVDVEGVITVINTATNKIDDNAITGLFAVIYSDTEPTVRDTGTALQQGDTWYDTNDGNKPYVYSGSAWVAAYTAIDGGNITTGTVTASRIDVSGIFAEQISISGTGYIQSTGYSAGSAGFRIEADGDAEFNDVTVRGIIVSQSGSSLDGGHIVDDTITASKIVAGTITATEIASGTITATQIAAGTITATQIASDTITAGQIAAGTITATEIATGTITATQIATDTITASQIAAGTITATEIATGTITATQIASGTITATEIASATITASQIAAGTITATQIATGTITATQLAADSVTADKIDVTNLNAVNASTGALTVDGTLTISTGGSISGSNYEFTDAGGNVAGWQISTDLLRSATSGARVELNKAKSRVSIFDGTGEKVAMGYLEGLDKNSASGSITASTTTTITDSTKDWATNQLAGLIVKVGNLQRTITSNTATVITCAAFPSAPTGTYSVSFPSTTYGFWAKDGDDLFIDGDVVYESGDWIIQNDGSLKILNGAGQEIIRLGTDTGEKGLFNYDTSGNTLSKFTSTGLVIGDDYTGTDYLEYDQATGTLTLRGTLNADDITAGTINTDRLDVSGIITAGSILVVGSNISDLINDEGFTDFDATDVETAIENNVTVISGSKITTGTIDASTVTVTNINASNITAGTLSADRIASSSITADKLSVTSLSAIDTDTGSLTVSGTLTMGTSGSITNSGGDYTIDKDGIALTIANSHYGGDGTSITWGSDESYIQAFTLVSVPYLGVTTNGILQLNTGLGLDINNSSGEVYINSNTTITGTLQAGGYKSSDGTTGLTTGINQVQIEDVQGTVHTFRFKNGLLTEYTTA